MIDNLSFTDRNKYTELNGNFSNILYLRDILDFKIDMNHIRNTKQLKFMNRISLNIIRSNDVMNNNLFYYFSETIDVFIVFSCCI